MGAYNLNDILHKHKMWLEGEKGGKKADLSWADLRRADLSLADLRSADLTGADLRQADLRQAVLSRADLTGAYLMQADLRKANLTGADLRQAVLRKANLTGADLRQAVLSWADLRRADLTKADLIHADLRRANLTGADLIHADLRRANLTGADLRQADLFGVIANEETGGYWQVCPEEGSFIGFKKLKGDLIAKLEIPAHAKRSSATTRKCRCSEAKVLEITGGDKEVKEGRSYSLSIKCGGLVYNAGETVFPDSFDEDRWNECSNGIHFFMTRREAELY